MRPEWKRRAAAIAPTVVYAGACRSYVEPWLASVIDNPAWMTRLTAIGFLVLLFQLADMVPDAQWNTIGLRFSVGFFVIAMVAAIMLALAWGVMR